MNHEKFTGAEQLVADNQRTNGIVCRPSTRVADDVCVTLFETCKFCGVEPRVHAGENREVSGRGYGKIRFIAKVGAVIWVRVENLRQNLTHLLSPLFRSPNVSVLNWIPFGLPGPVGNLPPTPWVCLLSLA